MSAKPMPPMGCIISPELAQTCDGRSVTYLLEKKMSSSYEIAREKASQAKHDSPRNEAPRVSHDKPAQTHRKKFLQHSKKVDASAQ